MKHWMVGRKHFGMEVEIVETLDIQTYFDERYGDCEIEHVSVKDANGNTHYTTDGELIAAGDWSGVASRFKFARHQELRDAVGDLLVRSNGITARQVAEALKLDEGFTEKMLARLKDFGWAKEVNGLWHPDDSLIRYRSR
jgi:hypothetical protein